MNRAVRERNPKWRTRSLTADRREIRYQRFRLQVIAGPNRGVVAASDGSHFEIGTAPTNDLVIVDPTVSRHHCMIEVTERGFVLRDLGSTNGTHLAGFRIVEAFVDSGAIITIGETSLRFDSLDGEVSHPLSPASSFGAVLGTSAPMRRIFSILERVANVDATVLLTGETGTGKGALAEAIHQQSDRRDGPFVVVDCGAIAETLIESELFGHERGAFTGAESQRIGAFEAARGGTVFLDEIGELSADLQPKLLRVLENHQVRRLGSTQPVQTDVRIIAATNRDLRAEVNQGTFRADLFFRLNVFRIEVPPLSQRREDIPLLASQFYRELSGDLSAELPPELLMQLLRQSWSGNVRELRSFIERTVILGSDAERAGPRSASLDEFDFSLSYRDAKEYAVLKWEKAYVPELVRRFDGNLSRAARAVSMDRNHLRKLLKRSNQT